MGGVTRRQHSLVTVPRSVSLFRHGPPLHSRRLEAHLFRVDSWHTSDFEFLVLANFSKRGFLQTGSQPMSRCRVLCRDAYSGRTSHSSGSINLLRLPRRLCRARFGRPGPWCFSGADRIMHVVRSHGSTSSGNQERARVVSGAQKCGGVRACRH